MLCLIVFVMFAVCYDNVCCFVMRITSVVLLCIVCSCVSSRVCYVRFLLLYKMCFLLLRCFADVVCDCASWFVVCLLVVVMFVFVTV